MKKTILSLSALLISFLGTSQTWNFNNEPQVDASAMRYLVDTTSVNYSSLTGSGQTWDYSQLGGYMDNERIVSITNTDLYTDVFPDATHMQMIPGFMNTAFNYETNNDKIAHGYEFELPDFGIVQFIFENRQKMLQFPMSLGSAFEDELAGTIILLDEPNPAEGGTWVKADGTGTLMLANDISHSDVLRIHTQDTIYAEITLTGLPFPTSATIIREQYDYMKSSVSPFPLFTHATLTILNPLIGQVKLRVVLSAENPEGFANTNEIALSELSVFPNPSNENVSIQLPLTDETASVTITDVAGNILFKNNEYSNVELININHLPAGLYFVQVNQSGVNKVQKLIKK